MAQASQIPQQLMTAAILHFDNGVPISDCNLQNRILRDRLARVHHVYWQWIKSPYIDVFELFRQLLHDQCSDRHSLYRMAQRDKMLFDFVKDHVALSSRQQDEAMVRAAANQAIRIGLETDNPVALTKGGKLLMEVAGLDKPESEQTDMSKAMFLPPVVVTDVSRIDDSKQDINDSEMRRIMAKYGGVIDEKMRDMDEMVEIMEAKSQTDTNEKEEEK